VEDLEFFFWGGREKQIVFFQVVRHKYLKTAQFIDLDARPIVGPGTSVLTLNPQLHNPKKTTFGINLLVLIWLSTIN